MEREFSKDYVLGIVEAAGNFTFSSNSYRTKNGMVKRKIPTFILEMLQEDGEIIKKIGEFLGIQNKVYVVSPKGFTLKHVKKNEVYERKARVRLIVRDVGTLKNSVMPMLYGKFLGSKKKKLEEWIREIDENPEVREDFKIISRLARSGYFS